MTKQKSVTQRAAEAIKAKAPSAELTAIKSEITQRIQEVEAERRDKTAEVERVMGDGDLEKLRSVRQDEVNLKDEDTVLRRLQSELHRAIEIALGEEIIRDQDQHRERLAKALEQAGKARAMLEDCQQIARELADARRRAANIGEALVFDGATIRSFASAIHPEGNLQKQTMIDLGIHQAMKAA
jgi:hypothetical protein